MVQCNTAVTEKETFFGLDTLFDAGLFRNSVFQDLSLRFSKKSEYSLNFLALNELLCKAENCQHHPLAACFSLRLYGSTCVNA